MYYKIVLGAFAALLGSGALAQEETRSFDDTLTKDWGGYRKNLYDRGLDLSVVYKGDVFHNATGGIKTGTRYIDNLDVILDIDDEKLLGIHGMSGKLHFINNNGRDPDADLIGSGQGIDNVAVPRATSKLYQAWLQQNFMDDRISVLGGLYAVDSEFYITDASSLFIHPTYGFGTDFAQSGLNGPAVFPFSALGVRVALKPTSMTYVQAAVVDGVPGDPNNPTGTQIELREKDGTLMVAEAGVTPKDKTKFAIGSWLYTAKFDDIRYIDTNGNPLRKKNYGFYGMAEAPLSDAMDGFVRLGTATDSVNQFDLAWSTGVVYTGLMPAFPNGQTGLAISQAYNGQKYRNTLSDASISTDKAETAIELTYSDQITPWLTVQPDVQYIINPSGDPTKDNALAIGLRTTVNF
jgi:porin